MRTLITLLLLLAVLPAHLDAEDHIFETYGSEQGLTHMYVYSISQDSLGYIWIGTNDGAYRFDGIEFDHYTTEQGLSENFITKVFTDSKGRVWFGHQSGSVSLMQDGKCDPFTLESEMHGAVMDFLEDESGRIWILVQNLGLIKLNAELDQQIFRFSNDEPTLSCLSALGEDLYLLGTHEQLYLGILDESSSTFINPAPVSSYPGSKVSDIITLFDGSYIIISQDEGIYNLVVEKNSGLYILNTIDANEDGSLDNLQEGLLLENGDFLVSSMGSGIIRFSKDASGKYMQDETINSENGLQSDNVKSIFQDGQGNLWCGMYGEGLGRKVRNNFSFYNLSDIGPGSIYDISGHSKGMLVSIDENLLIVDVQGKILKSIPFPGSLKQDRVNSIYRAPGGQYYLGFENNGLYMFTDTRASLTKVPLSNNRLSNSVNHITGDELFTWVCTKHGLCRIDVATGIKKWYTSEDGLPYNSVQSAFIDSKKRVLLATISSHLPYITPDGELKRMGNSSDGSLVSVSYVYEDIKENIWLCTEGEGLWILHGDSISKISEETGLFSNYCYTISEDTEGKLLVGHRGAMSEIDIESPDIKIYGRMDGIHPSTEFYPGAVFTDAKNNRWFGTSNGLIKSTASKNQQESVPPILNIKSIYIDGEKQDPREAPFQLETGNHEIRIEFCGISYMNPEAVSYQTMLEGYSSDWSPMEKQRQVIYERVNHGTYSFHLRAFDSSGQQSELLISRLFIIEKPVYLSLWFYIFIVLFISIAFFLAIKLSGEKLKSEQSRLLKRLDEKSKEVIAKEEVIKERLRMEKVLLEEKMKAELSEKLKTAFLRNMSHEIRTPMNAVLGFSDLLKKDDLSHKLRDDYIDIIHENSENLLSLIDDILDVSKLEARQLSLNIHPCNLKEVMTSLQNSTKVFIEKAGKKEIKLLISIPEEGDHIIQTDEYRFKQVFLKLLDNAVKFTSSGSIHFGYTFENENIRFFVKDTGIGLSADKLDVIFDLFRKETESKVFLYSGTGLGLTLARHVSNLLGGDISVESEEDQGSVFSFILPRIPGDMPINFNENSHSLSMRDRWKGKKILVVEDTESNFLLLDNLLAPTAVDIDRTRDGEDALKKYAVGAYHLIIMDIKLPGIDGYETTRMIRMKDEKIDIVAYSAYATKGDREKILKSGFNDYIAKPSSNETILNVIASYLDKSAPDKVADI